jgi:hypothetical protein
VESITTGGIKKNLREQVVALQKGRPEGAGTLASEDESQRVE